MTRLHPPPDLSPEMAQWWAHVATTYRLEPHHVHLLTLACQAYDEAQRARAALEEEGITIATAQGGRRSNPAAAVARDARITFARLLRELDLDFAQAPDANRPPALASNRRRGMRQAQVLRLPRPDGAA